MRSLWMIAAWAFVVALPTVAASTPLDGPLDVAPKAHQAAQYFAGLPSWSYAVMPFLVAGILLAIAFVVLLKGQPVIYNRVFFAYYALSGTKSFIEGLRSTLCILHGDAPGQADCAIYLFTNFRSIEHYAYPLTGFFLITLFLWFVTVFPRPIVPWLKDGRRGAVLLGLALPFVVLQYLPLIPPAKVFDAFNIYVSALALIGLGLLIYHAWETDSDEERMRIRLLSFTFFLVVFSTILVTIFAIRGQDAAAAGDGEAAAAYNELSIASGLIVAPILEILGSIVLMYAILRYQLLGTELFLKRLTRGTMFAVTIGVVFVIVSNSIEQVFQITVLEGVRFDFIIAGFISAVTMYPVQKGTEKIANKLFPRAGSTAPDYLSERRMEIFEAQLRYALLDGVLKEKELTMLQALRASIEITEAEIRAVAENFPQVPLDQVLGLRMPTKTPPPPPTRTALRPAAGPPANAPRTAGTNPGRDPKVLPGGRPASPPPGSGKVPPRRGTPKK